MEKVRRSGYRIVQLYNERPASTLAGNLGNLGARLLQSG